MEAGQLGIREVAAEAGVSITTVSHALSGKRPVAEETRRRVIEVVERLGYWPRFASAGLRRGPTRVLGLTVTPIQGFGFHFTMLEYYRLFIECAAWTALSHDYVVVVTPPADGTVWRRLPVDGAIVVDPRRGDLSLAALRAQEIPTVTLGRELIADATEWVDSDSLEGTRRVLRHLESQGAMRIALLSAPPVTSYSLDCLEAYRAWCTRRGVRPLIEIVENPNEVSAMEGALRLLKGKERPDAIYGTFDTLGSGALAATQQLGMDVPDEILLVTCSESEIYKEGEPFLTRRSVDPKTAARWAIEMLIEIVETGSAEESTRIVPSTLILRSSTERRSVGT